MKSDFPDAITFDAAGTLFATAEPVEEVYSRIAGSHGITAGPKPLQNAFRNHFDRLPCPHSIMISENRDMTGDEAEQYWWRLLVRRVFEDVCASGPLPERKFTALFEDLFQHYAKPSSWRLAPDILEVLSALQTRTRLGVISNFDYRFHRIAEGLGLSRFFEAVILSADIKASKPDPAIFKAASRKLGVPPDRILHIGDDPIRDCQGARNAGFRSWPPVSDANPVSEILNHFNFG